TDARGPRRMKRSTVYSPQTRCPGERSDAVAPGFIAAEPTSLPGRPAIVTSPCEIGARQGRDRADRTTAMGRTVLVVRPKLGHRASRRTDHEHGIVPEAPVSPRRVADAALAGSVDP